MRCPAQPGSDLLVRLPLQFEKRHALQLLVAQQAEQPAHLLGDHGGGVGRRLPAGVGVVVRAGRDGPAAALPGRLASPAIDRPAGGQFRQQPPQLVPVVGGVVPLADALAAPGFSVIACNVRADSYVDAF